MKLTESEIVTSVATEMGTPEVSARFGIAVMTLFSDLEGADMTRERLFAASAIGSAMRGFDDHFDSGDNDSANAAKAALESGVHGQGLPCGLQQGIKIAIDNLNPTANGVLVELAKAQFASRRQKAPDVGVAEISLITENKGGLTAMLFASAVNESISEERRNAYHALGVLMQLVDDYCDTYLDVQDGIQTLMTITAEGSERDMMILRQFAKVKALSVLGFRGEKLDKILQYAKKLVAKTGIIL